METVRYYSIGQVAKELKINTSTIRSWEIAIPGLRPKEIRGTAGRRYYTPEEVERVRLVRYLTQEKKMTLAGTREYLRVNRMRPATTMDIIQTLTRLRGELDEIRLQLGRMSR